MSDGSPIPPATFEFLVYSLLTQAQLHMGMLTMKEGDEPQVNLPAAQHTIDMLAMIAEKTKGNLTLEEQRLIENSLTEMRFRFVQANSKP